MTQTDTLQCPHAADCGGCAFIGVPYREQLEQKEELVRRAFARYPEHAALPIATVLGADPTVSYRSRAKLVFGENGALGLYERDSHRVIDIPGCQVLDPALSRVAAAARRVLSPAATKLDGLDLRLVDGGVMATLIAPRDTPIEALTSLAERFRDAAPDLRSVAASFREPDAATVLGTGHRVLSGPEVERHHLLASGPYHLAAHGAFTQAHPGQANAAHTALLAALRESSAKTLLELYAGSGALALRMAHEGFAVTAVESFAPALQHAERAAGEQALKLHTVTSTSERALTELNLRRARFDALIVNPPRRGLSPEVRRGAAALEPSRILYMSCDPATLARDLAHFGVLGYSAKSVAPFDMIPHSAAVECLVHLERAESAVLRVLHEDEQLIAVVKSGYEALNREPGNASCLAERVRRLPGAARAVALSGQGLDADSSGVCLFAREPAHLPLLEAAFSGGTQNFVGLARGVTHKRGRLRRPIRDARGVVSASTRYVRDAVHAGHSLLTIWPDRSSPRQFRQLFVGIGHPLLGDARFGDAASNGYFQHRHGLDRSFLHCSSVTLAFASKSLGIEAALPGELSAVLASLREPTAPPS